ncbi:MAG: DUF4924 family protein [Muribaculaceae bacterium]|nr:DUF4924 family protein [Muribaculaceae bacterium]
MTTTQITKDENIAEHLLYMWQIEDIIRANDLDIAKIEKNIIDKYPSLTKEQRDELMQWYENLIEMMRLEDVKEKGHLQINKNTLIQLVDLHQELLKSPKYPDYSAEFYRTLPFIVELRAKAGENMAGEIETCFNALYGLLLLRLKGEDVSPDTAIAMKQITRFIALLSKYFKQNKEKPLFDYENDK